MNSFGAIMNKISDKIVMDESISGRRLPGIYFLLTHSSSSIRSWAMQMAKVMGSIGLESFRDTIQPIFRSWYQVSPYPEVVSFLCSNGLID